jgi:Uma2 family endonuclease
MVDAEIILHRTEPGLDRPARRERRGGVRLDETGLYCYPDLTIVCGEPAFAATRPVSLLSPRVIEVLSETTEEYDRGARVAHYRHRASVDLILLIDSRRRMVERQQRNPDGT